MKLTYFVVICFCIYDLTFQKINNSSLVIYNYNLSNQTDYITNTYSTTTTEDLLISRSEIIWQNILQMLNSNDFNQVDINLIGNLVKKANYLVQDLTTENIICALDIYRVRIILEAINSLNPDKFHLNEIIYEHILQLIDNLIYLNGLSTSSTESISVFQKANLFYNNSSLVLFDAFEGLTKYFRFQGSQNYKMKNIQILVAQLNPFNNEFVFGLNYDHKEIASIIPNKSVLTDSITLNKDLLKKFYGNNTIKMSFKIYFNNKKLFNHELINIEHSNRNFFFDLINNNQTNFVSNHVLSVNIHETFEPQIEVVRIQFIVLIKEMQNAKDLKCVHWNFTSLKWSSDGCYTSIEESGQVNETRLFKQVCYCNHLASFALILNESSCDMNISLKLSKIITLASLITTSLCYLLIISMSLLKINKNNFHEIVLKNFYFAKVICLILTNLFFAFTLFLELSLLAHQIIYFTFHYFLLSSFGFSLGISCLGFKRVSNYYGFNFKWISFSFLFPLIVLILNYFFNYLILILLVSSLLFHLICLIFKSSHFNNVWLVISFIFLVSTWCCGSFILIITETELNQDLKLLVSITFFGLNSFHGSTLLIGLFRARNQMNDSNKTKFSGLTYIFICFYGFIYLMRRIGLRNKTTKVKKNSILEIIIN